MKNKLCCPICLGSLSVIHSSDDGKTNDVLQCFSCKKTFFIREGLPDLFVPWEIPKNISNVKFGEFVVSSSIISSLAGSIGADLINIDKNIDPRAFFHTKYRKFFVIMRMIFWVFILGGWFNKLYFYIGLASFLADYLIVLYARKNQYNHEIAQLFKFSNEGKLHAKEIFENIPDAHDADAEEVAEGRFFDIEKIIDKVDLHGKDVIHVGCGGYNDADINNVYLKKGANIIGVDIYEPSLRSFKKIFPCDAVLAEALCQPFKNESFDFSNCTDIIEHVHDPFRFLQENFRVLKRGGKILLVTPNLCRARRSMDVLNPFVFFQSALSNYYSFFSFPREMMSKHKDCIFFHTAFTINELKKLCIAAGFEIERAEIKAYRGGLKSLRKLFEYIPFFKTINDSLFILATKK